MAADTTDYVVLKEVPVGTTVEEVEKLLAKGGRIWVELDGKVPADKNTEAIAKVTEGFSDDDKRGNYAAPSVRNFPVIPRSIRTEIVDEFGAPSTTGMRPRKPAGVKAPGGDGGKGGELGD